ncbi:MATE family efflux transporter [Pseudomonas sp.]|uniref:MATE family efflux transporter n=1 Tax=Pseudomonas sp. TaxID=306 RepID=UPI00261C28C8|nr:MATE family efflux transporter [Pseudomonas sp.]
MEIARISIPLILSRLGEMIASLIYFSFIGHFAVSALSDASFAWALASFLTVVGIGFFSPLLVKVAGSNDLTRDNIAHDLNISFRYAILFGALIISCITIHTIIQYNSPTKDINLQSSKLLLILSLHLPATFIQLTIFNFFNAIKITKYELTYVWLFNFSIVIAGTLLTLTDKKIEATYFISAYVVLKWLFTALTLCTFNLNIRAYIPQFRHYQNISRAAYAKFFLNGLPLALCLGGESSLFFIFTLISKSLGDSSLAAYQASLHFLSIVYMISIGVGNGTGIVVAHHFTSKNFPSLRSSYIQGMSVGLSVLIPTLIASLLFIEHISLIYTSNTAIRRLIEKNIIISLPFILFEYIYIITRTTLRSMGDFWVPALMTILSLNLLGLTTYSILHLLYEHNLSAIFLTLTICSLTLMLLLLKRFLYIFRISKILNR